MKTDINIMATMERNILTKTQYCDWDIVDIYTFSII